MATINSSNINITDLDFDDVSKSLKEYLKGQTTLKDYDLIKKLRNGGFDQVYLLQDKQFGILQCGKSLKQLE